MRYKKNKGKVRGGGREEGRMGREEGRCDTDWGEKIIDKCARKK